MRNKRMIKAAAAAVIVCMLTACSFGGGGKTAGTGAGTSSGGMSSGSGAVQTEIPEQSIINFHNDRGFARLRSDMESGDIPVECNVLYDTMGTRPDVTVKDPAMIREIYDRLCTVTVGEKSTETLTDSYHHVTFRLRNDSYVSCYFEGENLFCWGKDNYTVSGSGSLWSYVRQLQETAMKDNTKTLAAGNSGAAAPNAGSEAQAETGANANKQDPAGDQSDKGSSQQAGSGQTQEYKLDGGAPDNLDEPEVSGGTGRGGSAKENTETASLTGGNPTGDDRNAVGSGMLEITGETPAEGNAGSGEPAVEPGQNSGEEVVGPASDLPDHMENQPGDEPSGEETSGTSEGTEIQGGSEEAPVEQAASGSPEDGSGQEDTLETPQAGTDTDSTAGDQTQTGQSGDTQSASAVVPDAAYTEIVRAYAAVKAQDPKKFLEDYEKGVYKTGSGQTGTAGSGQTASAGGTGDAAAPAVDPRINYEMFRAYFSKPEGASVYYGLRDYNEDHMPELVILMGSGNSPTVWAVYTYDGTRAVPLFTGKYTLTERNTLSVLPDGRFMIHGSSGASSGTDTICRIAADRKGLEVIAAYTYDADANGSMDHISDQETLTDDAFREKYSAQESSPSRDVSPEAAKDDSQVITAPAPQNQDPVVYEEIEERKERHEFEEYIETRRY